MKLKELRQFVRNTVKDVAVPARAAFFAEAVQSPRVTLLKKYLNLFARKSEDAYVSFEDFAAFVKQQNALVNNLFSDDYFNSNKEHVSFFKAWKNEPKCIFYLELMQKLFVQERIITPLEILEQLMQSLQDDSDRSALSVAIGFLNRQKQQHIAQERAQAEVKEAKTEKEVEEAKKTEVQSVNLIIILKKIITRLDKFKNKNEVIKLLNAFFTYFPIYHYSLSEEEKQLFQPVSLEKLAEFLTEHRWAYFIPLLKTHLDPWEVFAELMNIMPEHKQRKAILRLLVEHKQDPKSNKKGWEIDIGSNIARALGNFGELIPRDLHAKVTDTLYNMLFNEDAHDNAVEALGKLGNIIPQKDLPKILNFIMVNLLPEAHWYTIETTIKALQKLGKVIPKELINKILSELLEIVIKNKNNENLRWRLAAVSAFIQIKKDIKKFRNDIQEEKATSEALANTFQAMDKEIDRLVEEFPSMKVEDKILIHTMEILRECIELISEDNRKKIASHLISVLSQENIGIFAAEALVYFKEYIPESSINDISKTLTQKFQAGDLTARRKLAKVVLGLSNIMEESQLQIIVSSLIDRIQEDESEVAELIACFASVTSLPRDLIDRLITSVVNWQVLLDGIRPCEAVDILIKLGALKSASNEAAILEALTSASPGTVGDEDTFIEKEKIRALRIYFLAKLEKDDYEGMLKSVPIIYGFLYEHLKTCRDDDGAQVALISAMSILHARCMDLERARVALPLLHEQHDLPRELYEIVRSFRF